MNEQAAAYGEPQSPYEKIIAHRKDVRDEHPGWRENSRGDLTPGERPEGLVELKDLYALSLFDILCDASAMLGKAISQVESEILEYRKAAAEKYEVEPGGTVGNYTLQSYDGLIKIEVSMGCIYSIDPEIAEAKDGVFRCIERWSVGANENLVGLATAAFSPSESSGQLSRTRLGYLLDFQPSKSDPEWTKSMEIIRRCINISARKRSIRVYWRLNQREGWQKLPLSTVAAESVPVKKPTAGKQGAT
jgi:hypothetical protein